MTEYEKFQQIMSDLNYFFKNGVPRNLRDIKDKDGNVIFDDIFGDVFNIFNKR